MNQELKNILLSFYTALIYPVSGILALAGIILFLEPEGSVKTVGVGLVTLALLSMFLFTRLSKRQSDKPMNTLRVVLGMMIFAGLYWALSQSLTAPAV